MNKTGIFRVVLIEFAFCLIFCAQAFAAPATPTVISPVTAVESASPEFVWVDQGDAVEYRLWLYDNTLRQRIFVNNFFKDDICSSGICSVQPEVLFSHGKSHRWYVRARNVDGYGEWEKIRFNFLDDVPAKVALYHPSGIIDTRSPDLSWERSTNAIRYKVYVRDLTEKVTLLSKNYNAIDVCNETECQVVPEGLDLPESNRFVYRVRAWNSGGWSDWSDRNLFEINMPGNAPVAVDDNVVLASGSSRSLGISVLNNDTGEIDVATVNTNYLPGPELGYLQTDIATGVITYVPYDSASGTDQFNYSVKNIDGVQSNVATVTVTVDPSSTLAVMAIDDFASTTAGDPVEISVLSNDSGNLILSSVDTNVSPVAELGFLSLNETSGVLTYTPYAGNTGTDTFGYRVSDDSGAVSNIATVTVTINGGSNTSLAANDDFATTSEGSPVDIPVLANDTGTLVYSSVDTNVSPAATLGFLALNESTGVITYTPYAGSTGTDTFGYRVSDTSGAASNVATVTVTIGSGSGGTLLAVDDSASTTDGTAVEIFVLANDNGNPLPSSVDTNVSPAAEFGYLALDESTGALTYTPYPGNTGTDTFGYRVSDSSGAVSNVAVVTVTVGDPVNQPPQTVDDAFSLDINTFADFDVLQNDSDDSAIDASTLVIDTSQLTKGSADIVAGNVRYTNTDGTAGTDTFTYTVKDDAGLISGVATVVVTVMDPAPAANDDSATLIAWEDVTIDVLANDTINGVPVDPSVTSIIVETQPLYGTVTFEGSQLNYAHDGTQATSDSFTYSIEDAAHNTSNIATVIITITPYPDVAPEAADDLFSLVRDTARLIPVLSNDIDRNYDLDPATLTIVTAPVNGDASVQNGQIFYDHDGSANVSDSITYRISDSGGRSDEAAVTISYEPVQAPLAQDDSVWIDQQGGTVTIAVLDNDTANTALDVTSILITDDADNDDDSAFVVNDDGTVTYKHSGDGSIEDSFSYIVRNVQGLDSNEATVHIRIKPRLFAINELSFMGAFSLPSDTFGQSSANYAQGVIEANGSSLFFVGHDQEDAIAEFTIPHLTGSYEIGHLTSAGNPVQNFSKVLNRISGGNPEGLDQIVGLEKVGDSLVVNVMEYYDGAGNNTNTTFVIDSAHDLSGSSLSALHEMDGAARSAGWLSEIPYFWQQELGATYISGNASGDPIISRLSVGPSAFAIDLPGTLSSSTSQQITALELQGFSLANPLNADLDNASGNNDLWTHLSTARYGFVVPGTRTYMTVGWSGGHDSGVSYKPVLENGQACPGFCANDSEDVYNHYWLWDMDDWLRVKNGEISPNQITPYDYGKFNLPFQTGPYVNEIGGASYDSATGLLYLSVLDANAQGFDNPPVIVAFNIGSPVSFPEDTVAVEPKGDITADNPLFRWNEASNSDYYRLQVVNKSNASVVDEFVYHSAEVCVGGVCEVQPAGLNVPASSDLIYKVRGENAFAIGPWDVSAFSYTGAVNVPPVANAGPDQVVLEGIDVMLDGSASSDQDGTIQSYVWSQNGTQIGAGVAPVLSGLAAGVYTIELLVTDDDGAASSDTAVITVTAVPNQAPTANAGPDQSVVAGANVTLDGSGSVDPDGSISSYVWIESGTQIGTGENLLLSGLAVGVYTIELVVTDDDGATATDTVVITVTTAPNQPPTANAGLDQSVVEGTDVTLDGSGSADLDGSIQSYVWSDGVTQVGTGVNPVLSGLTVGVYTIELVVTDDDGAASSDTVVITVTAVPNVAPTANAGLDQSVLEGTDVTLDGSGSADSDGTIQSYVWSDGVTQVGTGVNPVLSGLAVGVYTIELEVTDDDGAASSDAVVITVTAVPNVAPTANAGPDQSVVEGTDVTLDGSGSADSDGTIQSYVWSDVVTQVGTGVNPVLSGLAVGVYTIELVVTDNDGAASSDTVVITITEAPNQPPTADAGLDQSVVEGTDVTLDGSDSADPDGTIQSYVWSDGGTQVGVGENPVLTGLVQGVYTIELVVTDNDGAASSDTVVITVTAAPNVAPTANAGPDQSVVEGTNVTLDGSDSTDSDGTIQSYVWSDGVTQVGTGVNPVLSGLAVGVYTIELVVTDDDGAASSDTVEITVTAEPNVAPTADAGPDQSVVVGTDVTLDGSQSTDPEGPIASYVWTENGVVVGTGVSPVLTGLAAGVYTIELVVTDDDSATDSDTVEITVTAVPNVAPTADAGPDQSVVVGTDVTLDGGQSTDPEGPIASYVWTENGVVVGTGVSPVLTGLAAGVYTIELVVTDEDNATDSDTVEITVTAEPNVAPTADAGPDQSVVVGADVILDGSQSTDPEGPIAGYVWTENGVVVGTGVSPVLTGLAVGVYTIELVVTDEDSATDSDTVEITVTAAPNVAPVTVDDNLNVTAGIDSVIDVLGNDFDPNDNSEIDTLSFVVESGPDSGEGLVTLQPDGTISYEIARDTMVIVDSFTYSISDLAGERSNISTVTVNINVPPVAVDDSATVFAQQQVQIALTGNDTDANSFADIDPESIVIVPGEEPSSGTLTFPMDGSVIYTNTDITAVTDSFQYTVKDQGGAESEPATVNITIEPLLTGLTAIHRDGQTFLTWDETGPNDQYHVYRYDAPITPATLAQATKVTNQWGPLTSTTSNNVHGPWNRCVSASLCISQNFVIEDNGQPLTDDTGLFVYTTQSGEAGDTYYAVTSVVGGVENTSTVLSFSNAVVESVSQPTDVIAFSNGNDIRIYTQFMDYQDWNPTFNGHAYNYGVVLPDNYNPGQSYPLLLEPHAYGDTMITVGRPENELKFPGWDFIQIHPHDPGFLEGGAVHSWWYGYAANHNYESQGSIPSSGRIENFTEQRLMRAIDAVIASPRYNVDEDLIHAYGHSMGASGSLALGMRYPSVISGIYASQPMTDYAASPLFQPEFVQLWGTQQSALNILNSGPRSQDISLYGSAVAPISVWDWMDHQQQLIDRRGDDFAYLMYSHGKPDETINWETQGQPTIQAFTAANAGFSARFNEQTHSFSSFNSVVSSLFGLDSSDFTWKYPLDLSFPAIQNASGSGPLVPTSNINIVDSYNLNIEWATPHTVGFSGNIIDQPDLYQITIRSTDTPQTADITPRRTQQFDPGVGQQCGWTAIDNNTGQVLGSGNSTVDADSLLTIPDVNITTGGGTRLRIDCGPVANVSCPIDVINVQAVLDDAFQGQGYFTLPLVTESYDCVISTYNQAGKSRVIEFANCSDPNVSQACLDNGGEPGPYYSVETETNCYIEGPDTGIEADTACVDPITGLPQYKSFSRQAISLPELERCAIDFGCDVDFTSP